MPRFGAKTLLIAFALLAVWLTTFSGFPAASDVRRSLLLLVLVASLFLAVYSQGKQRAYWSSFTLVMFLCGGLNLYQPLNRYVPDFAWEWLIGANIQQPLNSSGWSSYPPIYSPSTSAPNFSQGQAPAYTIIAPIVPSPSRSMAAIGETLAAAWILGLSALSGFIAAYIFSRTRSGSSEASLRARQIVEQELQRRV